MQIKKNIFIFSFFLIIFSLNLNAQQLTVNQEKSSITIVFKQIGVPIKALFNNFKAKVAFDEKNLDKSKAEILIDIFSFDLGDPDYNSEVLKEEWFNAKKFPNASFVSSGIEKINPEEYKVVGDLNIKGTAEKESFIFNLKKEDAAFFFKGSLPISRTKYNIGDGDWKDTSIVADEVLISFKLYVN